MLIIELTEHEKDMLQIICDMVSNKEVVINFYTIYEKHRTTWKYTSTQIPNGMIDNLEYLRDKEVIIYLGTYNQIKLLPIVDYLKEMEIIKS